MTQAFSLSYISTHKQFKDCTSRHVSFLPTGERYFLIGEQESIIENNLGRDGGRKSWDSGAADMVEAPRCQTEGRWIESQPSTTS